MKHSFLGKSFEGPSSQRRHPAAPSLSMQARPADLAAQGCAWQCILLCMRWTSLQPRLAGRSPRRLLGSSSAWLKQSLQVFSPRHLLGEPTGQYFEMRCQGCLRRGLYDTTDGLIIRAVNVKHAVFSLELSLPASIQDDEAFPFEPHGRSKASLPLLQCILQCVRVVMGNVLSVATY